MTARFADLVVLLVVAAVLALLGRWGRANALSLVPRGLPEDDQARRASAVRRGGMVCYLASGVMAVAGVLAVV